MREGRSHGFLWGGGGGGAAVCRRWLCARAERCPHRGRYFSGLYIHQHILITRSATPSD